MENENWVLFRILQAWGAHPRVRLARTNTGVGWFAKGEPARKSDPGAYPVKFGVPGTGDATGLIAPQGRFLMVETKKTGGKQRQAQKIMQRVVTQFGGLYVLAFSLEDMDRAMAAEGIHR